MTRPENGLNVMRRPVEEYKWLEKWSLLIWKMDFSFTSSSSLHFKPARPAALLPLSKLRKPETPEIFAWSLHRLTPCRSKIKWGWCCWNFNTGQQDCNFLCTERSQWAKRAVDVNLSGKKVRETSVWEREGETWRNEREWMKGIEERTREKRRERMERKTRFCAVSFPPLQRSVPGKGSAVARARISLTRLLCNHNNHCP